MKRKYLKPTQTIYRRHTPSIRTRHGNRCMSKLGEIRLPIRETNGNDVPANYILVPMTTTKDGKTKVINWNIHKLADNFELPEGAVESWNNLDNTEELLAHEARNRKLAEIAVNKVLTKYDGSFYIEGNKEAESCMLLTEVRHISVKELHFVIGTDLESFVFDLLERGLKKKFGKRK